MQLRRGCYFSPILLFDRCVCHAQQPDATTCPTADQSSPSVHIMIPQKHFCSGTWDHRHSASLGLHPCRVHDELTAARSCIMLIRLRHHHPTASPQQRSTLQKAGVGSTPPHRHRSSPAAQVPLAVEGADPRSATSRSRAPKRRAPSSNCSSLNVQKAMRRLLHLKLGSAERGLKYRPGTATTCSHTQRHASAPSSFSCLCLISCSSTAATGHSQRAVPATTGHMLELDAGGRDSTWNKQLKPVHGARHGCRKLAQRRRGAGVWSEHATRSTTRRITTAGAASGIRRHPQPPRTGEQHGGASSSALLVRCCNVSGTGRRGTETPAAVQP